MARRTELESTVKPSLLDRLVDPASDPLAEDPATREASIRAFKRTVTRDVEWLLNTRRTMAPAPAAYAEVTASVYEYGLPDITAVPVATKPGRDRILANLHDTLTRFEPRLTDVRVQLVDSEATKLSTPLRFVIEATLQMDLGPERVVFDTVVDVARGTYEVQGDGRLASGASGG